MTIVCESRDSKRCVRIEAQATARLECDRTLRPFSMKIAGSHEIVLLKPGEYVDSKDEAEYLALEPWQTKLDLTMAVRDTLLLAVPVRKVDPEAKELVIQTVFGAQPSEVSEYWEVLRQI